MPVSYHGAQSRPTRVDPALETASHVFLRVDAVRRPLVPPYLGPFRVLRHGPKTFEILQNGKTNTVSIDRLKPAFILPVNPDKASVFPSATAAADPVVAPAALPVAPVPIAVPAVAPVPTVALDPAVWPLPTRYGRRPRLPDRLNI